MKRIILILAVLSICLKTNTVNAEGQILNVSKSKILIPTKYQLLKNKKHESDRGTCIKIRKNKYEAVLCFKAGREFADTYEPFVFRDKDPSSERKLPPGTLVSISGIGGGIIPIKKKTIGEFDVYESVDYICRVDIPNEIQSRSVICYISVVNTPYGVSFYVHSNYAMSYYSVIDYESFEKENYDEKQIQLDRNKQLKWIQDIIKSIKILEGEPVKKTRKKVDFKPSFDCAKSRITVEKTICADEYLSQLDVSLSESYDNLLHYSVDKDKPHADQRAWLKQRNACKTATCIQTAYEKRITKVCTQYPISGNSEPLCSDEVLYEIDNIYSLDRGK